MISKGMFDVKKNYDVIVVGGGLSGICAAVSAAREGARTALIERYGILGGMLTSGNVYPILGMVSEGTIYDEVVELLGADPEGKIVSGNLIFTILQEADRQRNMRSPVSPTISGTVHWCRSRWTVC